MASVEVIAVLRDSGQVHNAEVGTPSASAIGSRLAQVIEAGPDELASDEAIVLHQLKLEVGYVGPRSSAEIVRTDMLDAAWVVGLAVGKREGVVTAGGYGRRRFAVKNWLVRLGLAVASVAPPIIPAR